MAYDALTVQDEILLSPLRMTDCFSLISLNQVHSELITLSVPYIVLCNMFIARVCVCERENVLMPCIVTKRIGTRTHYNTI